MASRKLLIALIILMATLWGVACGQPTDDEKANTSFAEDGKYLICPVEESVCLTLLAHDDNGVASYFVAVCNSEDYSENFHTPESYRARDTLLATWDETTMRFWVYSSDTGTSYWDYVGGEWIEHKYDKTQDKDKVPSALKQARPKYFQ